MTQSGPGSMNCGFLVGNAGLHSQAVVDSDVVDARCARVRALHPQRSFKIMGSASPFEDRLPPKQRVHGFPTKPTVGCHGGAWVGKYGSRVLL